MRHLHKDQLYKVLETTSAGKEPTITEPVHQDMPEESADMESPEIQDLAGEQQVIQETSEEIAPIEVADSIPYVEKVSPYMAEKENLDHHEFIDSIEKMISETNTSTKVEDPITIVPQTPTPVEPLVSADVLMNETIKETLPENADNVQVQPVQNASDSMPAQPEKVIVISAPKTIKAPVIPEGVRISAVKFKTLDLNKKQPPAKISIKPHIKPLNRTPRDINRITQQRAQTNVAVEPGEGNVPNIKADAELQNAASTQPKTENSTTDTPLCPSCNEKIAGDSQFCLKCGADLKSQKVRCPRCSQINARETTTCVRCGARMIKSPVKQPDML
jgi:DNA-directed RNA polymerase subunit RPC12/RpoP